MNILIAQHPSRKIIGVGESFSECATAILERLGDEDLAESCPAEIRADLSKMLLTIPEAFVEAIEVRNEPFVVEYLGNSEWRLLGR